MINLWLRQNFKHDGIVLDAFVSGKTRNATKTYFGFIRFKSALEAENIMRRNDGLQIKGHRIRVFKAKYYKKRMEV